MLNDYIDWKRTKYEHLHRKELPITQGPYFVFQLIIDWVDERKTMRSRQCSLE